MSRLLFIVMSLLVFASNVPTAFAETLDDPLTLRVALYPFVPMRRDLFFELEAAFEKNHPGVDVELIEEKDLLWNYYSGGLKKIDADVYEVDTILLSDMIAAGKLSEVDLPSSDFSMSAIKAVTRNGKVYAVPHWLCGNFLFYREGDAEIEGARTWDELLEILSRRDGSIFVDLKGSSTLGEWYFTMLASKVGLDEAEKLILTSKPSDPLHSEVVSLLTKILQNCPKGFCRSEDIHDKRTGFYARSFVRGQAHAYVGYSESLHYGLKEELEDCLPTSGCLGPSSIGIRALPSVDSNRKPVSLGWVDGLALDSGLTGRKRKLAKAFIDFLVSDEGFLLVLEPEWNEAPKLLLPARPVRGLTEKVPIYPQLLRFFNYRETGTKSGLNGKLRQMGKRLDCALPFERPDNCPEYQD